MKMLDSLKILLPFYAARKSFQAGDEEPAAGEPFSPERLQTLATELAAAHLGSGAGTSRPGNDLLARLEDNRRTLAAVYQSLSETIADEESLTPAAEWLIDNFHVVEEQLREAREDLPRGFYRELPKLGAGKFAGFPRVYHLAFELVAHSDNRLDKQNLKNFLDAYQEQAPLTMGELWAFPISLRLALVENLRRYAARFLRAREASAQASRLADEWTRATDETFAAAHAALAGHLNAALQKNQFLTSVFSVELGRRLRDGNRFMTFALETLDNLLRSRGETLENLTRREHSRQAAAQVSVANIISSMRLLSTLDWGDFFESVSEVDRVLRDGDPAAVYARMDFKTRDVYRHRIERISKKTKARETDIARRAVEFAARVSVIDAESERKRHVGYFLINPAGRAQIEQTFGYRPGVPERAARFWRRRPTVSYLSAIFALTTVFLAAYAFFMSRTSASTAGFYAVSLIAAAVALAVIPASELAISIVNRLTHLLLSPQPLPKMNFERGIPPAAQTFIVIPTLLADEISAAELCERLEVCFLANRDEQLFFALLGDLPDAPHETMPGDDDLRQAAQAKIDELNLQYATESGAPRFFFFSRRRAWNAGENAWICLERKWGNLREFNRLLRGSTETDFAAGEKPPAAFFASARYVITLDADTQMPRGAAQKLIGTIEHPLNRPIFDEKKQRVVSGYGIIQPRVEVDLVSGRRTAFARFFSEARGFDPYTTAVSDVYQDLFGAGIYVGKGLYDVDAFRASLDGRVPENRLLSHDLFEGLFAGAALASDIVFYDDYPANYESFSRRRHRWTRGDWQIARWLLGRVPDAGGKPVRNELPVAARWKIFDNLRRSLLAPALVACLVAGWSLPGISPIVSTVFALLVITAQLFLEIAASTVSNAKTADGFWENARVRAANLTANLRTRTVQIFWRVVFLAHEAFEMIDAAARVSFRLLVSHKHLLEWETAAQIERQRARQLRDYLRRLWFSPVAAVVCAVFIAFFAAPGNLLFAAPFFAVWLAAPFIAYLLSRAPRPNLKKELNRAEKDWMRFVARRTWRYFETFVGQTDHWLPPDNFQQDPAPLIAHRTSPTNIGLFLLATLAARDFGYLGTLETVERLELSFSTLERLPRFRGHFYNWYDTRTLAPLAPEYVSTVDSGNLAGHLIALAEGCLEMRAAPLFDERTLRGLADTFAPVPGEIENMRGENSSTDAGQLNKLTGAAQECRKTLSSHGAPETLSGWKILFDDLEKRALEIAGSIDEIAAARGETAAEAAFWATAFKNLVINLRRDLETLALEENGAETSDKTETARTNFAGRLDNLAAFCRRLTDETDFGFLYDDERKVLTIGYRPAENRRDNSFYDLLASEARLASFIAVASGDAEQEHWFHLGRTLVAANGSRALVSWSGTMFEYMMPQLVMREFSHTLLAETSQSIVRAQIEYGEKHNVPWGVSESAYNARDLQLNYQYAPFGVPGLGLKRGLADDLVVAPYASALAAQVEPHAAMENLRRLAAAGMFGQYGFYEAIDYTRKRLPPGQTSAKIEAFMTHHQAMIFLAFGNLLHDCPMPRRFHSSPLVESAELLLQERVPRENGEITRPRAAKTFDNRLPAALARVLPRRFDSAAQSSPPVCLLSNGSYTVMLSTAGSGFSRRQNLAVTRWREDAVRDDWGQFIFLRDARSGAIWSAGLQPVLREPQDYEVIFTESKAEFQRRDAGILTRTEIIVSAEDDAELRRVSVTNESGRAREIEITSYGEVVLNTQAADEAHRAFSQMFVETEFLSDKNIILAHRRCRSKEESEIWAAHTVSVAGKQLGETRAEMSRAAFLGRGGTVQKPFALEHQTLGENGGEPTLDAIFSLSVSLFVEPGATVSATFSTVVADSRETAAGIAGKYSAPDAFGRAVKLAWTRSQVELRHLNVSAEEANLFQTLAGHLIYADSVLRPRPEILRLNAGTQRDLWKYGIGGDLPILLVRVGETVDVLRRLRRLVRAQEFLRAKNLIFDLVVLNEQPVTYAPDFAADLRSVAREARFDKAGGIFVRRADIMSEADRIALHAAARVCIVAGRGTLEEQLAWQIKAETLLPAAFSPRETPRLDPQTEQIAEKLLFPNKFGGFSVEKNEYVVLLETAEHLPPTPWANVIANENEFGFLTTEAGMGAAWSQNSRENRLTPWSNDAVTDAPSEAVYLRDEMTGVFWTPTALPVRENLPYRVRHGQGYTIYEHRSHGIEQELLLFAALRANVKILRLRLKNVSERRRTISATHYAETVLGVNRAETMPFVLTEIDAATGAIFARNPRRNEFAGRVAFAATGAEARTWTCDRREFFGRNGTLARPQAMLRANLSGAAGAGLDACFALQTSVEIEPGETKEIVFLLGEEGTAADAREIVARFRRPAEVETEFQKIRRFWNDLLTTIEIKTPDPATDLIMNRWLVYQTLSCRFWARTSQYQSSGAFGFRDQLQDATALVYTRPDLARAHILRAAARQFKEGDVLHWWHEPAVRGSRTRSSDDLLWLPFVACFYAENTGDDTVFDENAPFIEAPALAENQDEAYVETIVSLEKASVYEHCVRALERALPLGERGLPLIGAGDWSDGLTGVGEQGRGESVWLGWFLIKILRDFSAVCRRRGDLERARKYQRHADKLKKNLEAHAWDGEWYRRGYFDDGTPFGSRLNEECRIDAIAQSWSVISGAGAGERAREAMRSVEKHLVVRAEKLSLLFTPPFDKTALEPGYIKGYPPGIRENGGQYTHAAAWNVVALAMLGEGDRAFEIFEFLNPINHALTAEALARYKTEPFAAAADIYAGDFAGRGGWTWYTGAAAWMYRAMLENVLGFQKRGAQLAIEPCIPRHWREFQIEYRCGASLYRIIVENPHGVSSGVSKIEINGKTSKNKRIELSDNNRTNLIRVTLGDPGGETQHEKVIPAFSTYTDHP